MQHWFRWMKKRLTFFPPLRTVYTLTGNYSMSIVSATGDSICMLSRMKDETGLQLTLIERKVKSNGNNLNWIHWLMCNQATGPFDETKWPVEASKQSKCPRKQTSKHSSRMHESERQINKQGNCIFSFFHNWFVQRCAFSLSDCEMPEHMYMYLELDRWNDTLNSLQRNSKVKWQRVAWVAAAREGIIWYRKRFPALSMNAILVKIKQ